MATAPPQEQPPPSLTRFVARVAAYTAAEEALRVNLKALITRFWFDLKNPYSPTEVATYSDRVAKATRAAQLQGVNLAIAQQRALLADQNLKLARFRSQFPDEPRGVPQVDVAQRAAREARIFESRAKIAAAEEAERRANEDISRLSAEKIAARQAERQAGADLEALHRQAMDHGLQRAMIMADDDLNQAAQDGYRQALVHAPAKVIGYRRVIHPELSASGTCGLCVAASDRIYKVAELLPLHGRCKCTVSPVTTDHDPGDDLNAFDLGRLYKLAGPHTTRKGAVKPATSREALTKVRYAVDEHGELGPRLRARSKGAGDPATEIVLNANQDHGQSGTDSAE